MSSRLVPFVLAAPFLLGSNGSNEEARTWADFLDRWARGVVTETEAPPLERIERRQAEIVRARSAAERATVQFASSSAELDPAAQTTLLAFASAVQDLPGFHFQVSGHTDSVPIYANGFRSNHELSLARAEHVRRFLVRAGVPAGQLLVAGWADSYPIAPNDDAAGRALNRRVELRFIPFELLADR